MKLPLGLISGFASLLSLLDASGQHLPDSLSFSVSGSFANGVAQGSNSILIADNDLTNGHRSGMDLQDAPASLNPSGPSGSAAFQWGKAADWTDYGHSSALWFEPLNVNNVSAERYFDIGYLYYRNGTIETGTGASSVDLALKLAFSSPAGIQPMSVIYTNDLFNTPNSNDPIASADIVSLRNWSAPFDLFDASGNQYFLELTFKVDQDTIDGTLSTQDEFRVFEGGQGRAELVGRFTTNPGAMVIPEPSVTLLAAIGLLAICRRKR